MWLFVCFLINCRMIQTPKQTDKRTNEWKFGILETAQPLKSGQILALKQWRRKQSLKSRKGGGGGGHHIKSESIPPPPPPKKIFFKKKKKISHHFLFCFRQYNYFMSFFSILFITSSLEKVFKYRTLYKPAWFFRLPGLETRDLLFLYIFHYLCFSLLM